MKIDVTKLTGGVLMPCNEQSAEAVQKLTNNENYTIDVKINQNYKLLQKVHVFFKFCAQHYYGDINVSNSQIQLTRDKLTMSAGYVDQVFMPDGERFVLYPKSISYENMKSDERAEFYSKIVSSALKNVFHSADENTLNKLIGFF